MVMATGSIKKQIYKTTVTGTTTASGALNTNLDASKYLVIGARSRDVSCVCLPRDDSYITIREPTNMSAVTGRSTTVDVWYVEI